MVSVAAVVDRAGILYRICCRRNVLHAIVERTRKGGAGDCEFAEDGVGVYAPSAARGMVAADFEG